MDLAPQQSEHLHDDARPPRGRALGRGRLRGRVLHTASYSYARAEVTTEDDRSRAHGQDHQRAISQPLAQVPGQRQLYDPYAGGPGFGHARSAFHALDNKLDLTRRVSVPAQRNVSQSSPRMHVADALLAPPIGRSEHVYHMGTVGSPIPQSAPATANPNSFSFEPPYVLGDGGRRGSVQLDHVSHLGMLDPHFRVDPSRAPDPEWSSGPLPPTPSIPSPIPPASFAFPRELAFRSSPRRRNRTTDAVVLVPVDLPQAPTLTLSSEDPVPTTKIESLYRGAMQEKEALEEMDYQQAAWQLALGDEPSARSVSPAMQLSLLYWFSQLGGKGKLTPKVRGAYATCAQAIHTKWAERRARRLGPRNGSSLASSPGARA